MKKKSKLIVIITAIIIMISFGVVIFLLSGKKVNELSDIITQEKESTKEISKVKIVNTETKSRPYAIMINNLGTARPLQSGLQDAYIIYEIIVEGGLTRYMALFLDQNTERIGSIRSCRHYYLDYALENDAIYVHHGQSYIAAEDFKTLKNLDRIEVSDSKTGWRDKELRSQGYATEHTLFTNIEKLNSGLGSKRTERNKDLLLDYSATELDLSKYDSNIDANKISIKYSGNVTTSYEYDINNKVYNRFVNGKSHNDYVTGKQYTFKNIITYQVDNYSVDDYGRQDLNNIGSGSGYFISNGKAVKITWEKTSRESQTVYKYEDGKELVVNDGNTFIQIQPTDQKLTIE